MISKLVSMSCMFVLFFILTSSAFADSSIPVVHVTNINISPSSGYLDESGHLQLNATITSANATDKTIIWTSSNTDAVTIDTYGQAELGPWNMGKATIYATTRDGGKVAKALVTAPEAVRAIMVSAPGLYLKLDQAPYAEKVTFVPIYTKFKSIKWTTDDASIAMVDSDGNIRPVGIGNTKIHTTIAATGNRNGPDEPVQRVIPVRVIAPASKAPLDVLGIQILVPTSPLFDVLIKTASLNVGSNMTIKTAIYPTNAANARRTYSSSDESVATVSPTGVVTGVKPGNVKITASTANGVSDSIALEIIQPITSITTDAPESMSLKVGDEKQVNITIQPKFAPDHMIEWTSSNPGVAVVEAGRIKAVSPGVATIMAKAIEGSNKSVKMAVTVPRSVTGIKLNLPSQKSSGYVVGKPLMLQASVLPLNATVKSVAWISSDTTVAVVGINGAVTPLKEGTSIITVSSNDGIFKANVNIKVFNLSPWSDTPTYAIAYSAV